MTSSQYKMIDKFKIAATEKKLISFIDYHGSGFKYALKYFIHKHPFNKIAYANISFQFNSTEISIDIMRQFMNIRFSTLGYKRVTTERLVRDLSIRVKQDLKHNNILLVFDNVDRLNTISRLSRFLAILKYIKFPCGIILRTNRQHIEKIRRLDEKLYTDLMEKPRVAFDRNTGPDMENLCRAYGLKNPALLEEISKKTPSFTVAMIHIKKYLQHSPVIQLELELHDPNFL